MYETVMLDTKEMANYLNISITEVYRIKDDIPYTKIGNKLLFNKEIVNLWILSKTRNLDMLVNKAETILKKYSKELEVLKNENNQNRNL